MANLGFREALFGTALALSCDPVEPEPRAPTPSEQRMCEERARESRDETVLLLLALGSFDKEYPEAVAERAKVECLMKLGADPEQ